MASGKDHSTAYAAVVGVFGIMFLLVLSSIGVGQAFSLSLVGTGISPGQVGSRYYEQTAITTNYHMGNDPSLDWRWVEWFKAGSSMVDKPINTISLPLKTHGLPAGIVNVAIWNSLSQKVYDFGTINANTISQTMQWYTFRGDTGTYTVKAGDRIGIGFHAGDINNYVTAFGANTNPFETDISHRQRFNGTHWVGAVNEDLTAVIGYSTASGTGDITKPTVTVTQPGEGATVTAPFTVTGTVFDDIKVQNVQVRTKWFNPSDPLDFYWLDYVSATPRAFGDWSSWSITLNPTKAQYILVDVTDTAGNHNFATVYINLLNSVPVGDTTPPSITITSPANGASITSTSVAVTGLASDNKAIGSITWSMDGGGPAPVAFTPGTQTAFAFNALDVPLGVHTITVLVLDTAGLSYNAQVIFTVASSNPNPDPTCQTGSTWDPVLKVCVGNPADPTCQTGFHWDSVLKRCELNDLPNPNPTQFSFGLFELIGGLGVLGAVIGTKAYTSKK